MFRAGDIEGSLTLDRTPFNDGLRQARLDAERFQREGITATVNLDAGDAERRLAELDRNRTINADLNLDTGAAEAKIELLKREAASIGGSIGGGGVGGTGGGGSASGPGLFGVGRGVLMPAALGVGASFLPTLGATAAQGALGAGALGVGGLGALGVGGAGILATAKPALTALGNVTTAQKNLNTAIATYGKDSTQAKTATEQLRAAQARLPEAGQRVASSLQDIESRWARLSMPAQNQFFGLLNDGIQEANRLMPMFANIAQRDMGAARSAADHFLGFLNTPDAQNFFQTMGALFATGVGPFERGLENIAHVLMRIAVASAPDVLKMLQGFQSMTHGWEQSTQNAGHLQHTIHGYVGDFRAWLDLAGSLGHVLSALFITNHQGAKTGKQELEAMSRQLDVWARWIDHHHHDITQFFSQLNQDFGLLLGSAGQMASVVLPAFQPVGNIIHSIVSDLNSIKVGPVSALTVLLGVMAGRSIGGKLGLIGGGTAAAGGLTTAEKVGAGAGGGATAATLGSRLATLLPEGRGLLPIGGAGPAALAAVAFQSLAGKPGTFLGPGIAGMAPKAGQFTHDIRKDLRIQQDYQHKSLSQLQDMRSKADAQWHGLWETDPHTAQSAGAEAMKRTAKRTAAEIGAQIRAEKIGTAFGESVAAGGPALKRQLNKVSKAFDDMSTAQQNAAIKSAAQEMAQLHAMGLITLKQEKQGLSDLEDAQRNSQQHQHHQWNQFGLTISRLVAGWFGGMTQTVNTLLGNKGITGMVNQLLTGVASQHKLKWNATTAGDVAGHLAGFLGIGGAAGGFIPGFSSTDNFPIMARGGEAILRPEDHVPIVSNALRSTYGFGLGDLFNRTGAKVSGFNRGGFVEDRTGVRHYAKGGMVFPFSGQFSWGRIDQGVDFAGTAGIHAMGDARIVSLADPFTGPNAVGSGGILYKLLGGAPKGFSPSSPYIFTYEGLTTAVRTGQRVNAGQLIGHMLPASLEMGFATSSGSPLTPYNGAPDGTPMPAGKSMNELLHALSNGRFVPGGGGSIGQIPKIVIHGPAGGIRNGIQGIADSSRAAANRFLRQQQNRMGSGLGGHSINVPSGFLSLPELGRLVKAHGGPPILQYVAWNESGGNPRAVSSANAEGLWQFLPSTWAGLGVPGSPFDPNAAAEGAHKLYEQQGLGPWSPSAYAGAHGGWHQDLGKGYTLLNGGVIPPGALGGLHPPEIVVPGGQHGAGVLSQDDTMRVLKKAAQGDAQRPIVFNPDLHVHVHAHPGSGAAQWRDDVRVEVEGVLEEYGDLAHAEAAMR